MRVFLSSCKMMVQLKSNWHLRSEMTKKTVMKNNRTGLYGCLWWIKWNSKVWQRNIQLWSFATFQNVHQHQRIFSDNKLHHFFKYFPGSDIVTLSKKLVLFPLSVTNINGASSFSKTSILFGFVCLFKSNPWNAARQFGNIELVWSDLLYNCSIASPYHWE